MATVAYLLAMREKAQGLDDRGQVKAINADLARLGYVDSGYQTEPLPETARETTALQMPEQAVPERPRRGRPPRVSQEW